MDSLPTPKFKIGDVVFYPTIETKMEPLPCPDCMGLRTWKVVTPAGTEFSTECQRCMGWGRPADLPKPERLVAFPVVRRLTVGKIEVTTHPWEGADPVRYMCCETGIGSGSIYDEGKLFATEADATAQATIDAAARTATIAQEPERLKDTKLNTLSIKDADLKRTWDSRWSAWYRYRTLRESIETALEDKTLSIKDKLESIEADIEWSARKDEPHEGDPIIREAVVAQLRQQAPLADCGDVMLSDIAGSVIDAVIGAGGRKAFMSTTAQAAE